MIDPYTLDEQFADAERHHLTEPDDDENESDDEYFFDPTEYFPEDKK